MGATDGDGSVTMAAFAGPGWELGEPPTLEVRWILPGRIDDRIQAWFGRFPAATESRVDDYLIGPDLAELSVKIRAGRALDVKMYRGPLAVLQIPDRAQGRMEFWQKWSFPLDSIRRTDESSWQPVHKVRRLAFFSFEAGPSSIAGRRPDHGVGCSVELTEVTMLGRDWWTLGFEAIGPTNKLRGVIESTAEHVFEQAPAEGVTLTLDNSGSYTRWLRHQRDAH
jgi:hypothetical protein